MPTESYSWSLPANHSSSGTLWVYGDSLSVRLFGSVSSRALCKTLYFKCRNSYNWLYPITSEQESRETNDDLDFMPGKVLETIRNVLKTTELQQPTSVLLLNLGLHYPVSVNFTTFQRIIGDVINVLKETEINSQGKEVPKYKAKVIWKSTTALCKHKGRIPHTTDSRFLTTQVCTQFKMCARHIFMIWTEGLDNLKIFIDYLNNIHPTIKFTSSHSSTNILFLDVNVSLTNDGNISIDLYTKPTDKHQHLLYSSCHPLHTKKAIPFSLALRLRRICSTDETFNTRTAQLTTYLLKRGYKRNFITKQIQRAADIPRSVALQTKDINKPTRIPFITTFNPSLPHISNIIKRHYNLLLSSDRCKQVFPHLPVVAFRRSSNLRDLLVTAKLSSNSTNPHPQLPSGSFRCGKNCATCPYISHGLTNDTFFSTGQTHPIKSNLICETKNLIYMIQCNRCNLQYIGETKRRLKDRFNEHRRTIDNPNAISKPTTAAEHFLTTPNHTADMQLIPIVKVHSKRDSVRKAREAFLICKGRTIDPHGLNIHEETY